MKPRKRIAKVSKRQQERLKEYGKIREAFLKEHLWCECCLQSGNPNPEKATEIHHLRGRLASLLFDTRYFLAVGRKHHDWIGANPDKARLRGWLAKRGDWNRVEQR